MDATTQFSMDWNNIQFKAKDVILLLGYLIAGLWFASKISSTVERQGEIITEMRSQITDMKNDDKGNSKDTQLFIQSIQNQVNATNTQVRLLEQRVDALESNK